MVNSNGRRESEGDSVTGGACGVVAGGADAASPAKAAEAIGGKGKKRGKRSRQGHKAERSGEEAQRGKTEVGLETRLPES